MGWKEEQQYRFQYTSDGRGEMAWQPSSVYKPSRSTGKSRSFGEMLDTLAFYGCVFTTVLAYGLVGHAEFMRHLYGWLQTSILVMTIVISFVGTAALLQSKIVQRFLLLALIACGLRLMAGP